MPSRRRLLEPCLCGFVPQTIYATQAHRRACQVWLGRDRQAVRTARRYETLFAKGLDPARLCPECHRVEHVPTCSRYHGRAERRADLVGGEDVMQAIIAGLPKDWVVSLPVPQATPMQVVTFIREPERVSYRVTLSCGHTLVRRRVPKAAYCHKCQG